MVKKPFAVSGKAKGCSSCWGQSKAKISAERDTKVTDRQATLIGVRGPS